VTRLPSGRTWFGKHKSDVYSIVQSAHSVSQSMHIFYSVPAVLSASK